MSVAQETVVTLDAVESSKASIATQIAAKGVTVPEGAKLADMPTFVASIQILGLVESPDEDTALSESALNPSAIYYWV